MKTSTVISHCRTTYANLNESEISKILSAAVAAKAGVDLQQDNVKVKVFISKRDRVGTSGFETCAEVTITEDLRPQADAAEGGV